MAAALSSRIGSITPSMSGSLTPSDRTDVRPSCSPSAINSSRQIPTSRSASASSGNLTSALCHWPFLSDRIRQLSASCSMMCRPVSLAIILSWADSLNVGCSTVVHSLPTRESSSAVPSRSTSTCSRPSEAANPRTRSTSASTPTSTNRVSGERTHRSRTPVGRTLSIMIARSSAESGAKSMYTFSLSAARCVGL